VRRLASRRICSRCGANADPGDTGESCQKCGGELVQRVDDNEAVVRERLRVYQRSTRPVLDFYRQRPTFRTVNGAQPLARVAEELDAMVDEAAAERSGSRT
jgi:adenylate kinase